MEDREKKKPEAIEIRVSYAINALKHGLCQALRDTSPHNRSEVLLSAVTSALLHLGEDKIGIADIVGLPK